MEVGNTYGTMEDYTNAEIYFNRSNRNKQKRIGFTPGIMAGKSTLINVLYGQ
ncbi:MAG: hypothetical protein R2777_06045 [Chitinophagales bacterium]